MHVNHEYLLDFIQRRHPDPAAGSFLDYGCGSAEVVLEGRKRGWDFFGADVFYEADTARKRVVEAQGLLGTIVREIHDAHLDFPDAMFDMAVTNQVFEHIAHLQGALREIARVLKPGGMVLSLFPAKCMVLEPHWGVPAVHWFPKRSGLRLYYTWGLRRLGVGYRKAGKSPYEWAWHVCDYVDRYTYYRTVSEIDALFQDVFAQVDYLEDDYLLFRYRRHRLLRTLLQQGRRVAWLGALLKAGARIGSSIVVGGVKRTPQPNPSHLPCPA